MRLADAALPEYIDLPRLRPNDVLMVPFRVSGFREVKRQDGTDAKLFRVIRLDTGEEAELWSPGFKPEHMLVNFLRSYPGEFCDIVIGKSPENRYTISDWDGVLRDVDDQVPF